MPSIPVVIYPTPVQGVGAGAKLAEAIRQAASRAECDVLILCRGGGSIEDLWAFNEEIVARAIACCPMTIVSGVGHETDFTIADFVADLRAATPTGASELACPSRGELLHRVELLRGRMQRETHRALENRMQYIDMLSCRLIHPSRQIDDQLAGLGRLRERLVAIGVRKIESSHWRLRGLARRLMAVRPDIQRLLERQNDLRLQLHRATERRLEALSVHLQRQHQNLAHLNPELVLQRGYSIAYSAEGSLLTNSAQMSIGDTVRIVFAKGSSRMNVIDIADG
jgi:exodeoxyribonuclease VII large subunit